VREKSIQQFEQGIAHIKETIQRHRTAGDNKTAARWADILYDMKTCGPKEPTGLRRRRSSTGAAGYVIKTKNLATTIQRSKKLQRTMDFMGWNVSSARELGEPGNRKALVREVQGEATSRASSEARSCSSSRSKGSSFTKARDGKSGFSGGQVGVKAASKQVAENCQKSSWISRRQP
jgi:hypothetical protein